MDIQYLHFKTVAGVQVPLRHRKRTKYMGRLQIVGIMEKVVNLQTMFTK